MRTILAFLHRNLSYDCHLILNLCDLLLLTLRRLQRPLSTWGGGPVSASVVRFGAGLVLGEAAPLLATNLRLVHYPFRSRTLVP